MAGAPSCALRVMPIAALIGVGQLQVAEKTDSQACLATRSQR